jgi:hypothetical protein
MYPYKHINFGSYYYLADLEFNEQAFAYVRKHFRNCKKVSDQCLFMHGKFGLSFWSER